MYFMLFRQWLLAAVCWVCFVDWAPADGRQWQPAAHDFSLQENARVFSIMNRSNMLIVFNSRGKPTNLLSFLVNVNNILIPHLSPAFWNLRERCHFESLLERVEFRLSALDRNLYIHTMMV